MAERQNNPLGEAVGRGYEADDFRVGWFVVGAMGLAACVGGALVGGRVWVGGDRAVGGKGAWVGPRLQPSPGHERTGEEDLEEMRRGEDRVFEAMGWGVEAGTHRVRVPGEELARKVNARRAGGKS